MFTGIVEKKVTIQSFQHDQLVLDNPWPVDQLSLGQSIAVNGCCLTLVECSPQTLLFHVSSESINRTNLNYYLEHQHQFLNLERAMQANARLDGHMVSGHIDGQCVVTDISEKDQAYKELHFKVPHNLLQKNLLVEKGSVALNGVSLTVNDVADDGFNVMVIPKTLEMTNLSQLTLNDPVNIEFDMIGKYIVKNMQNYLEASNLNNQQSFNQKASI